MSSFKAQFKSCLVVMVVIQQIIKLTEENLTVGLQETS